MSCKQCNGNGLMGDALGPYKCDVCGGSGVEPAPAKRPVQPVVLARCWGIWYDGTTGYSPGLLTDSTACLFDSQDEASRYLARHKMGGPYCPVKLAIVRDDAEVSRG